MCIRPLISRTNQFLFTNWPCIQTRVILEYLLFSNGKPDGIKIQDTRYKIQDTRYKIQDTRYKIQDTRYKKLYLTSVT